MGDPGTISPIDRLDRPAAANKIVEGNLENLGRTGSSWKEPNLEWEVIPLDAKAVSQP